MTFLDEVLVPGGNLNFDIRRAVGYALAAETGIERNVRRLVELVEFVIRGLTTRFQPLDHLYVAGRAGADPAAGMLQVDVGASVERNIQDAAGQSGGAVGKLGGVHLKDKRRSVRLVKGDLVGLLRRRDFRFFNIRVGAAHVFLPVR